MGGSFKLVLRILWWVEDIVVGREALNMMKFPVSRLGLRCRVRGVGALVAFYRSLNPEAGK